MEGSATAFLHMESRADAERREPYACIRDHATNTKLRSSRQRIARVLRAIARIPTTCDGIELIHRRRTVAARASLAAKGELLDQRPDPDSQAVSVAAEQGL